MAQKNTSPDIPFYFNPTGWSRINRCIDRNDVKGITKLLTETPELIHAVRKVVQLRGDTLRRHSDRRASSSSNDTRRTRHAVKYRAAQRPASEQPLHLAVTCGDVAMIQLILDHGAYIDPLDGNAWTPLCRAVASSRVDLVQLLLESGANPCAAVSPYPDVLITTSPLELACSKGSPEIVALLLKHGASVNVPNHRGIMPIVAAVRGRAVINYTAVSRGSQTVSGRRGPGPGAPPHTIIPSKPDYVQVVRLLCESGAELKENEQLVIHAVQRNDQAILELLLEFGAAPSAEALCLAASSGSNAVIELLLKHGANINAPPKNTPNAFNPLLLAAKNGNIDTVKLLVAHGADVYATAKTPIGMVDVMSIEKRKYGSMIDYFLRGQRELAKFVTVMTVTLERKSTEESALGSTSFGRNPLYDTNVWRVIMKYAHDGDDWYSSCSS
jgi:ankyrin repeat protein